MRTPAYPYNHYHTSDEALSRLLKDPFFKCAIMLASSSVYDNLQKADFEFDVLNPKVKSTLRKYYNRMSFRCTPFGLFSGVSTAKWGEQMSVLFDDRPHPKIIHSFERVLTAAKKYLQSPLKYSLTCKVNDTLYRVRDTFRFVSFESSKEASKRTYYLQEMKDCGVGIMPTKGGVK